MNHIDLLGWLAALIGATSLLPQLTKLVRTRNTAGVSLFFWQLMLGMNLAWISHGFVIDTLNMIVPNIFMLGCTLTTLAVLRRERFLSPIAVYPLGLAVGTVLIAGDRLLGPAVFGALAVIPGLIGATGQLLDIARSEDISGVSSVFLFWGLAVQISWLSWGILARDISTVIMATSMLFASVLTISWYLARRAGCRPGGPA